MLSNCITADRDILRIKIQEIIVSRAELERMLIVFFLLNYIMPVDGINSFLYYKVLISPTGYIIQSISR